MIAALRVLGFWLSVGESMPLFSCAPNLTDSRNPSPAWRFMDSDKYGYKSPNMGYDYSYLTKKPH